MGKKIMGFKGFDKDLSCRGFKYEVGKTYEHNGKVSLYNQGFHFCENPMDTWGYYDLFDGKFAEIEAEEVDDKKSEDSKRVAQKITIKAVLDLPMMIKASFDYIWEDCQAKKILKNASSGNYAKNASAGYNAKNASSGNYAKNASAGNYATNASSGYNAKNASSGYNSIIEMTGENSVGAGIGINNKIKAKKGCWITLAEWEYKNDKWVPKCVKSSKVDGKKIKAGIWYELKNEEFVEVKQ